MQRSFYSSGYLSNGNLSRSVYNEQNSSPIRNTGLNYSSSFLRELEKHHDRSIQIANDRLKSQELQHERNLESLRAQISSLKQQLDHNDRSYQREEVRLEEDYNYRLNILSREAEIKLRPIQAQIAEYEKNIERATLSQNSEICELNKSIQDLAQENQSIKPRIEVLKSELDNLHKQLYQETQQEISALDQEKKSLTRNHHSDLETFTENHRRTISTLHSAISTREDKIESLQQDLASQKRILNELIFSSEDEIRRLEDSLQSARSMLNRQEREIGQIHSITTEAKKESKVLNNEKTTMESDISRTRKENEYLKQEIKRLERLVYGKGSPRRS
ncbi:hypothetical protein SteCoe_3950 [Stentor coeruleus]|uniref:Uncharacterized protein n=1 Tax=Stentor coeruleus TaxID=5963 RepID=A0A1R2CVX6_9CILI|nr:hypothetical protein SteCoe_3950 [Stentor coeruleus]